jgi:predicted DCC family thiol-disulfide oxidoreductase YuxK
MNMSAPTHTVLYDGSCPLCCRAVTRLQGWDSDGILGFLLPFARAFARFGYRQIAQNRNALGCDDHCG